jgi:hypothetical protein
MKEAGEVCGGKVEEMWNKRVVVVCCESDLIV